MSAVVDVFGAFMTDVMELRWNAICTSKGTYVFDGRQCEELIFDMNSLERLESLDTSGLRYQIKLNDYPNVTHMKMRVYNEHATDDKDSLCGSILFCNSNGTAEV